MAIVDKFSPLVNFWETHPQLLIIKEFEVFRSGDNSEGKSMSSKIMWAISLVYDYESEYALQNEEQRIGLVENDWLESPGFFVAHETRIQPLIDSYMRIQYDAPRRALSEWDEGMDKRTKFLHQTPYTVENGMKLDKIRTETKKLMETRDKLKQEYLTKKAVSNTEGDYVPSLIEQKKL